MRNNVQLHPHQNTGRTAIILSFFAGLLAILCLMICGCGESGSILKVEDQDVLQNDAMLKVHASGPSISLMPSGDATQDTENLRAAILDPVMNSGGTLYLGPGTFYVHGGLVRQSFDEDLQGYCADLFVGTIKGSGKGVTTIKAVRGPGDAPFETFLDLPAIFMVWDFDYFGIRDLSFESESGPADQWEFPGLPATNGLLSYVNLGSGIYGLGGQLGTDCINVQFKGSLNSEGMPEIPLMWECYGGGAGVHNMKSCDFIDGNFVMMDYGALEGATINIGGKPADKNTYTNTTEAQVYAINAYGVGDCNINISRVEINNSAGFGFWADENNVMCSLSFKNNTINMIPDSWFAGVELWVEPEKGEISAVISNNNIHSDDSFLFGPIFTEGVRDVLIANNKITGRGSAAIHLGVLEQWPGSATLIGNNLQQWENTGVNPWGFTAAPIWLGSYVTNSVVVGGNNKVNIFDEPGYDWDDNPLPPDANGNAQTYDDKSVRENVVPKNNSFTGVNNMYIKVSHSVKNAMRQKHEAKLAMMSHRVR
ncbi:MAG: hypothetical protein ABIE07_01455 [Candidatus Zixiibacteriota bacterium]